MHLADRDQLTSYLKRHRLWLRKESGQHFLIDAGVIDSIIAAAELKPDDRVIEIGPGIGTLTAALANVVPNGLVLAVEKDFRLVKLLRKEFESRKNVKIIHEDARQFLKEILDDELHPIKSEYKLVANLPYNITGPVLRQLFDPHRATPIAERIVLMLQKEVVERLLAPPGRSARGVLTILRELYGPAEKILEVSKMAFFPVPAVDSAVVKITYMPDQSLTANDRTAIVHLAKLGFAAKRQMLSNALAAGLRRPKNEIRDLILQSHLIPQARAEDLTLSDWHKLATTISVSV